MKKCPRCKQKTAYLSFMRNEDGSLQHQKRCNCGYEGRWSQRLRKPGVSVDSKGYSVPPIGATPWRKTEENYDFPCSICGGNVGHLPNCPRGMVVMK